MTQFNHLACYLIEGPEAYQHILAYLTSDEIKADGDQIAEAIVTAEQVLDILNDELNNREQTIEYLKLTVKTRS